MDSLVGLGNDALDTEEVRPLGSPIAGRAGAVLVASQDNAGHSSCLVCLGSLEEGHDLLARNVQSLRAHLAIHELVNDTGVGKGASGHDLIVASSSPVGVEVLFGDSFFQEELGGRGIGSDSTGGRDVVSRDAVSEEAQDVGVLDILDHGKVMFHGLEEGRVVDVGA